MFDRYSGDEQRKGPWKWIVRVCACAMAALLVYARLAGGVDIELLKSRDQSKAEGKGDVRDGSVQTIGEPSATVEDYLSKITCTGCGRACLLSNPQCSVGNKQAEEAAQYYEADRQKQAEIEGESEADTAETAEEYLSKLVCNGCGRACPLSNPQCMTGMRKAQSALIEYYYQRNDDSINDRYRGYYGYGFDGGYGFGTPRSRTEEPDSGEWASM